MTSVSFACVSSKECSPKKEKGYYNYPNKLPFHFKEENITINKYALRKNSIITFNIETINNTIINVYFTTKEPNIEHYSIQEDIIFFLNTF